MAENLNYKTTNGSWCYDDNNLNSNTYGWLYDWAAAKSVCPSGWHLPSRDEWGALAKTAGGTGDYGAGGVAGWALKSKNGWNGNGNGMEYFFDFSAMPGGLRNNDGDFYNTGDYGKWWTATEYNSDVAYSRGMYYNYDYVDEDRNYKSYGFSVRCVQN
jgi:uncharacterized protein (TIGR02145 family)